MVKNSFLRRRSTSFLLGGAILALSLGTACPGLAGERLLVVNFLDIPCPGHVASILEAVRLVPGVLQAEVDYDRSQGLFSYDDGSTDGAAIAAALPRDCPAEVLYDGAPADLSQADMKLGTKQGEGENPSQP